MPTNLHTHIQYAPSDINIHTNINIIYIHTSSHINTYGTQNKVYIHTVFWCSLCFQLTWTFGRSGSSSASSSSSKGEALAIRDAWGANRWGTWKWACQNLALTSISVDHIHIIHTLRSPWTKHLESAPTTILRLPLYFFQISYCSTVCLG